MMHIIFDLDGTLIDSKREILDTYKKVFEYLPPLIPVDFDSINFGANLQSVLEGIYDKDSDIISKAKIMFAEIYDISTYENTSLYPSVYETLDKLHKDNFTLHIATNKRLKPTLNILRKKNMIQFFKGIKASDMITGQIITKDQMVADICSEFKITSGYMIGDSLQDLIAGEKASLSAIAVTYGYEKKDILIKKNPTFVIDTMSELYNIVKK